ncbi:MAG: hypothetical protein DHS20C08_09330 [Rhodomicrobium sp.]|nr:MAG: hypothetical protein DHS20C08_09330 [Rhodomicrobium sp.]
MMHQAREDSLRLRPISLFDVPRIVELANDWEVASMVSRLPYPYEPHHAHDWISEIEVNRREDVWAIESDGFFAGCIGYNRASLNHGELGYWLGRPFWGRGLATRASWQILAHGFTSEPFKFFRACHYIENERSRRVLLRLGFQPEDIIEVPSIARGGPAPAQRYRLPRQAFEQMAG